MTSKVQIQMKSMIEENRGLHVAQQETADIELFNGKGKNAWRVMTVIEGIPFYCSTGHNSKEKGTWFPHRGIEEVSGWIMKPHHKNCSYPKPILNICKRRIPKTILFRLNNVQSMCISASIGDGFWKKSSAEKLKNYLNCHYSQYFLTEKNRDGIKQLQATDVLKKVEENCDINKELYRLGSVVPLNKINSRLVSPQDKQFFAKAATEKIKSALIMLLADNTIIDETTYKAIQLLAQQEECFDYALENFLLEDAAQVKLLIKMIQEKQGAISKEDIIMINSLEKFDLFKLRYPELFDENNGRCALRILGARHCTSEHDVQLVYELKIKSLLNRRVITLLKYKDTYDALLDLKQRDVLNKESVKSLYQKKENTKEVAPSIVKVGLFASFSTTVGQKNSDIVPDQSITPQEELSVHHEKQNHQTYC